MLDVSNTSEALLCLLSQLWACCYYFTLILLHWEYLLFYEMWLVS